MYYFAELLPDNTGGKDPEALNETRAHKMTRLLKDSKHPFDRFERGLGILKFASTLPLPNHLVYTSAAADPGRFLTTGWRGTFGTALHRNPGSEPSS
jgi:hypothetical protein